MKYAVSTLEGALLDAAVAMAEGLQFRVYTGVMCYADGDDWIPSGDWLQGGPIIEREGISLMQLSDGPANPKWAANFEIGWHSQELDTPHVGPTPLIAAMRAYVASKFGEEVDLTVAQNVNL